MKIRGRIDTAIALSLLIIAIALVKLVPLRIWRRTLGYVGLDHGGSLAIADESWRLATYWRRRIDRAASYLPMTVKCLPRAMVMQWLMHRRYLPSQLVIAVHKKGQPPGGDRFHAYVILGDHFLIGECDLAHYRPLLTLGPHDSAIRSNGSA